MKSILIGTQVFISFLAGLVLLSLLLGYNDTCDCYDVPSDSTFNITLNANGGNIDEYIVNAKYGSVIQHEINHIGGNMVDGNIHYVLDGWTINSTSGARLTNDDTLERNIILFAVWEEAVSYEITVVITPEASDIYDLTIPEEMVIYNGIPLLSFIEENIEIDILNSRYQQYTWYYRSSLDDTGEYRPVSPTTRMPDFDINIKIVPIHSHRRLNANVVHDGSIDNISSNVLQENDPRILELYDYVLLTLTTFTSFENDIRQLIEGSIAPGYEELFILEFTNNFNSSNTDDVIITVTISLNHLRQMFEITVDLNDDGVIGASGGVNSFTVMYGTSRNFIIDILYARNITSTSHILTNWSGIPDVITSDVTAVAVWTLRTFSVHIDLNDYEVTNASGNVTEFRVDFDTTVDRLLELLDPRINTIISDSHKFNGWIGLPTENIRSDIYLEVDWIIRTFNLTINYGTEAIGVNTNVTTELENIEYGTLAPVVLSKLSGIIPTSTNLIFESWFFGGYVQEDNQTVFIQWGGGVTFTVTIDLNDSQPVHGFNIINAQAQDDIEEFTLPIGTNLHFYFSTLPASSDSHEFADWYGLVESLNDDITITAIWGELKTFTVQIDLNENYDGGVVGARIISPTTVPYIRFGTNIAQWILENEIDIVSDSHEFNNTFSHGETATGDTTIIVLWGELKTFTVTIYLNENYDGGVVGARIISSTTLPYIEFGANIAQWILDNEIVIESDSHGFNNEFTHGETATGDTTITVVWGTRRTFNINFNGVLPNATPVASIEGVPFGRNLLEVLQEHNITTTNERHAFSHWTLQITDPYFDSPRIPEDTIVNDTIQLYAVWHNVSVVGDDIRHNFVGEIDRLGLCRSMTEEDVLSLVRGVIDNSEFDNEGINVEIEYFTNAIIIRIDRVLFSITFRLDDHIINADNQRYLIGEVGIIEIKYRDGIEFMEITNFKQGRTFDAWFEGDYIFDLATMPARDIILTLRWVNEYHILHFETDFVRNATNYLGVSESIEHRGTPIGSRWVAVGANIQGFIDANSDIITEYRSTHVTQDHDAWSVGGFRFLDWIITETTMPSEDYTVEANWARRNNDPTAAGGAARITHDLDGGTLSGNALTGTVLWYYWSLMHLIHGSVANPTRNITREGHTFVGWYVVEFGIIVNRTNENRHFRMPAQNITIRAIWEVNTHDIYFETGVDGININPIRDVAFDTSIQTAISVITNPTKDGYQFRGWLINGETFLDTQTMPDNTITLVAIWANDINVSLHIYMDGVVDVWESITVPYESPVQMLINNINEIIDGNDLVQDRLYDVSNDWWTHWFDYYRVINLDNVNLNTLGNITEDIIVQTVFIRERAIITMVATIDDDDLPEGRFVVNVGDNLYDILTSKDLIELGRRYYNGNYYDFKHWEYFDGTSRQIVNENKLVPDRDPTLFGIFEPADPEQRLITIMAESTGIFNGNDSITFIIENYASLDIREFLLGLRDAMAGLHGNSTRYFRGYNFQQTPGRELLGFFKEEERDINILHTTEELSFDDNQTLRFYGIVRAYTHRAGMTINPLNGSPDYAIIMATGVTGGMGNLVLPSFHNGRKITQFHTHRNATNYGLFSSLNVSSVTLPMYLTDIPYRTFNSNQAYWHNPAAVGLSQIDLRGMPNLTSIGRYAFANGQHMQAPAYRAILIDRITPLNTIDNTAFQATINIRVNIGYRSSWQGITQPTWWDNRDNLLAGSNFQGAWYRFVDSNDNSILDMWP